MYTKNPNLDNFYRFALILVTAISLKPGPFLSKWVHYRVVALVDDSL